MRTHRLPGVLGLALAAGTLVPAAGVAAGATAVSRPRSDSASG